MLALTAALGPLPLAPDDLTHAVMSELADDITTLFDKMQDSGSQTPPLIGPVPTTMAVSNDSRTSSERSWPHSTDRGNQSIPAGLEHPSAIVADLC
jgi:hypothetical protein